MLPANRRVVDLMVTVKGDVHDTGKHVGVVLPVQQPRGHRSGRHGPADRIPAVEHNVDIIGLG
jgi:cobalamin-dependent methionine synthase I